LKQQIAAQQKIVDKIKSKMIDLKNDSGDIAKKIRSYDSDLQQNRKDQDKLNRDISKMSTGDEAGLAKAHKKMDKLMDDQTDYEKKLRNYKADLEKNTEDRSTEQSIFETANGQLESLRKRLESLK
jgi:chromosome segregation ATPase